MLTPILVIPHHDLQVDILQPKLKKYFVNCNKKVRSSQLTNRKLTTKSDQIKPKGGRIKMYRLHLIVVG